MSKNITTEMIRDRKSHLPLNLLLNIFFMSNLLLFYFRTFILKPNNKVVLINYHL